MRYQPACIALPESSMNTMITRLYRRGMTIVSNQRGYGLYCQEKDELLFMELQAITTIRLIFCCRPRGNIPV